MNLRSKLLIGYLLFVAALVAFGGWSAWRFRELSHLTHFILTENYDSVVAAEDRPSRQQYHRAERAGSDRGDSPRSRRLLPNRR